MVLAVEFPADKYPNGTKIPGRIELNEASAELISIPKTPKKRGRKKREKVEFGINVETLSLNAFETRNAIGVPFDDRIPFPDDFFTNSSKYRKSGSGISR